MEVPEQAVRILQESGTSQERVPHTGRAELVAPGKASRKLHKDFRRSCATDRSLASGKRDVRRVTQGPSSDLSHLPPLIPYPEQSQQYYLDVEFKGVADGE